jgi:hypothetical protein
MMILKRHTAPAAAVTDRLFAAGGVHENAPHGFRGGGEEVAAMVPLMFVTLSDQAQVGFVNQGRRFQSLTGFLLGQSLGGQSAQLVVNERQQLGRRVAIAGSAGIQDLRYVTHAGSV